MAGSINDGSDSQEAVAFKLFYVLRKADDEDRKKALDVFAECLTAVQNPAWRLKTSAEPFAGLDLSALTWEELETPNPPTGA
jgi:hypothetical protein